MRNRSGRIVSRWRIIEPNLNLVKTTNAAGATNATGWILAGRCTRVQTHAVTFIDELITYIGRIKQFSRTDWLVYILWISTISGLFFSTGAFLLIGRAHGVTFPPEAWLVPFGAAIFTIAIAVDTIGHRTVYKEALEGGEALVHHITIFCGVASVVLLILAYDHRWAVIPSLVFTALSFIYSLVDEVFHWRRYINEQTDRVETWSHVFILIGHSIMMIAWWRCYLLGYPGVAETLPHLH